MTADRVLFWIGAICLAWAGLQVIDAFTATVIGWILRRANLLAFYRAGKDFRESGTTDATERAA